MDSEKAASWLNSLSDKEFVDFFYSSIASRHVYPLERGYLDSHLVLANATRDREGPDSFGHWQLQLLCPTSEAWVHDAPICQFQPKTDGHSSVFVFSAVGLRYDGRGDNHHASHTLAIPFKKSCVPSCYPSFRW